MTGLIGRKLGMTRVFDAEGAAGPVAGIEAGPRPGVQIAGDPGQVRFRARKPKRGADPSGTTKGKRGPGQRGGRPFTDLGRRVVKVDAERNLLFGRRAVPGPMNGLLTTRKQGGGSRHD